MLVDSGSFNITLSSIGLLLPFCHNMQVNKLNLSDEKQGGSKPLSIANEAGQVLRAVLSLLLNDEMDLKLGVEIHG